MQWSTFVPGINVETHDVPWHMQGATDTGRLYCANRYTHASNHNQVAAPDATHAVLP